jgi:hypothetical protein
MMRCALNYDCDVDAPEPQEGRKGKVVELAAPTLNMNKSRGKLFVLEEHTSVEWSSFLKVKSPEM